MPTTSSGTRRVRRPLSGATTNRRAQRAPAPEPPSPSRLAVLVQTPFRRWLVIFASVLLVLGLLSQIPGLRSQDWHLRYLALELDSLPKQDVPLQLRRILRYQTPGIPYAVEALVHERDEVVTAAEFAIQEQVEQWSVEPLDVSTKKVVLLVRELSKVHEELSPSSKMFAAQLATRALSWPIGPDNPHFGEIVSASEAIMRGVPTLPKQPPRIPPTIQITRPEPTLPISAVADEPGGGLPIDPMVETVMENPPPASLVQPAEPRPLPQSNTGLQSVEEPALNRAPELLAPQPASPKTQERPEEQRPDSGQPDMSSFLSRHPYKGHIQQVQYLVKATEPITPAHLKKNGFSAADLVFASRLRGASTETLQKALEQLTRAQSLRTRAWLFWFSEHPNPQIREQAVAIMISANDPRLIEYLETRLLWESDREVARKIRELLKKRR